MRSPGPGLVRGDLKERKERGNSLILAYYGWEVAMKFSASIRKGNITTATMPARSSMREK